MGSRLKLFTIRPPRPEFAGERCVPMSASGHSGVAARPLAAAEQTGRRILSARGFRPPLSFAGRLESRALTARGLAVNWHAQNDRE